MRSTYLKVWLEATIFAALAMVCSFIPLGIGSSFSISLGMIPITFFSFRRGAKYGIISAFIWGLLHFLVGNVYFLTVSQVLIEYVVAFAFAGMAGFYAKQVQSAIRVGNRYKMISAISIGTCLGCFARYFWHFIAGVIFWGEYTMWGLSPLVFSLLMNGLSAIATAIVTIIVVSLIALYAPQLFLVENKKPIESTGKN